MLTKTIKYKNFKDEEVTKDFQFYVSKADLAALGLGAEKDGGMETLLRRIVATNDGGRLTELFEQLIMLSVGEKSEDGELFIKNDEIKKKFRYSEAYSELFIELVTDTDKMIEFVNGIVPEGMKGEIQKATKNLSADVDAGKMPEIPSAPTPSSEGKDEEDPWIRENREPTNEELRSMTPDQIKRAYASRLSAQ
jgi:hypothetical protein